MLRIRILPLLLACLLLSTTLSRAAGTDVPKPSWPRSIALTKGTMYMYQPQAESWVGNVLTARSAIQVAMDGKKPIYGVLWFTASTEVDKDSGLVTLSNFAITRSEFPASKDEGRKAVAAFKDHAQGKVVLVSLDTLQASLAANNAKPATAPVAVRDDVPRVIVQNTPAMLVHVYGDPVLRPLPGTSLQRVMNTPALLVKDPQSGHVFLYLTSSWIEGDGFDGPWTFVAAPDPALQAALKSSQEKKDADLFADPGDALKEAFKEGQLPSIYVATTPTELIVTDGPPSLQAVAQTGLQWVSNTRSDVFYLPSNKQWYVLLSGRWFTSPSLTQGPWAFVPGASLPADFARIPTRFARSAVLVSVPGTPQAQEAVIANGIAQTASFQRSKLSFNPTYDGGAPKFVPLSGTALQYAENSKDPVIMVGPSSFYALKDAVWFTASAAGGPWTVAVKVPDVIYTIPPSAPLYYVTFVRIYKVTPDTVIVGYTPGYYGSVVSSDGTVVYGTGYVYPTYVGTDYVVYPPYTYGSAAAYAWGTATGWLLGSTTAWWGPGWGWGWGPYGWAAAPYYWGGSGAWGAASNVYGHWGNVSYNGTRAYGYNAYTGTSATGVRGTTYNTRTGGSTTGAAGRAYNPYTGNSGAAAGGTHYNPRTGQTNTFGAARVNDNVYAGRDGNVYRNTGGGWQKYDSGSWNSVNANRSMYGDRQARTSGWSRPSGGFRGFGGGFRGRR
jgi:hypothetical protein